MNFFRMSTFGLVKSLSQIWNLIFNIIFVGLLLDHGAVNIELFLIKIAWVVVDVFIVVLDSHLVVISISGFGFS